MPSQKSVYCTVLNERSEQCWREFLPVLMEIQPWGLDEEERIYLDKEMSGMGASKKIETPGR
jgi:hypothetical protein